MNSLLKQIVKESHTLNVLYVEDHIETLEGMTMILEQMFHSIDTAINGEEALIHKKRSFTKWVRLVRLEVKRLEIMSKE